MLLTLHKLKIHDYIDTFIIGAYISRHKTMNKIKYDSIPSVFVWHTRFNQQGAQDGHVTHK